MTENTSTAVLLVTYNPAIERFRQNITAVQKQAQNVLIVDNSSQNLVEFNHLPGVSYIYSDENKGVAWALNQGFQWCRKHGYEWLLTLDQDSVIPEGFLGALQERLACALTSQKKEKVGLIYPRILDRKKSAIDTKTSSLQRKWLQFCKQHAELPITSGALINVNAALEVHGANESFFIDNVDCELDIKLKKAGYVLLQEKNATIDHQVGNPLILEKNVLWQLTDLGHPPWRKYFIYRNQVKLHRLFFVCPFWFLVTDTAKFGHFLLQCLHNRKSLAVKYSLRGIADAFTGKTRSIAEIQTLYK